MYEERIAVQTADGVMPTVVVWPEGRGPFPAVTMYHHIGGIHEGLLDMARRLASYGYCVFAPDLYYRVGSILIDPDNRDEVSLALRGVVVKSAEAPYHAMNDTARLLEWIRQMRQVDDGPIGTIGYCLGGLFAIRAACVYPEIVKAAVSLYGVGLEDSDGPEALEGILDRMTGTAYMAYAERDRHVGPEDVARLRASFEARCNASWEIEILEGTQHGFAFPGRPMFHLEAAEKTWSIALAMFKEALGTAVV
jgi:carboxymethylenebutenolidase